MLGVDNATSEVVHHFLRSLTVKVSRTTVCRLLDSPLGNTMQGISDALNALHVNNVVYQLQPKYLEKLHGPFITQLETSHSTFCLVEKIEPDRLIITTAEVVSPNRTVPVHWCANSFLLMGMWLTSAVVNLTACSAIFIICAGNIGY